MTVFCVFMTRYYLSRTLLALCLLLALRASLWAAVDGSGLLPVLLWMAGAVASFLICVESPEEAE